APDSLWASIEARLATPPARAQVIDLAAERERRRWSFSTPQLAAAAAALVVVSATAAWFAGSSLTGGRVAPVPQEIALRSREVPDRPPSAGDTTGSPLPEDQASAPTRSPVAAVTPGHESSRPTPSAADPVPAAAANFGVERYDTAIEDLERILAQNRSRLSPTTVQVVEKNLALIDGAIEDARRALAADPASPYLNDHLAETMKR